MHQKHPFRTRKGDGGFSRGSACARKGDDGFRQPAPLAYRAWLRCPWAAAEPGRATGGRPTLQTSSNQRVLNRLARTSVTNVVNLSRKISVFNEKAVGLTTFVTTRTAQPQRPGAAGVKGAGGPGSGARGQQRHHRHPHFARNLSRSFFETPQKRYNSNDAHSMFQ